MNALTRRICSPEYKLCWNIENCLLNIYLVWRNYSFYEFYLYSAVGNVFDVFQISRIENLLVVVPKLNKTWPTESSVAGLPYTPTRSLKRPALQFRFAILEASTVAVIQLLVRDSFLAIIWMFSKVSEFAICDNLWLKFKTHEYGSLAIFSISYDLRSWRTWCFYLFISGDWVIFLCGVFLIYGPIIGRTVELLFGRKW